MSPPHQEDWSDSDDEVLSDIETSVLLGVPDGRLEATTDIVDAAVSRIGGHPAFLPSCEPSLSSSQCKICSNRSELLVQMWCPFEDSPMDRALYIFGCARAPCQGKQGSVRAWRGLRHNEKYAAKLEKKRAAAKAKTDALARAEEKKNLVNINPFSMKTPSNPNPLGLGAQIFGDSMSYPPQAKEFADRDHEDPSDAESEASSSSEKSLLTALASVTIAESPWKSAPSYLPLYLSTTSEYLPPQSKPKLPPGTHVADPLDENGKGGKDISWVSEAYEDSLEMDHVFERFTKRVGFEGEQCVRYELNGTPLPFSSDKIFESLFPAPAAPALPVTKSVFTVVSTPKRTYSPSVPPCPSCKSKRVFECQLMPNLINVLRRGDEADESKKLTEEDRRHAVERALKDNTAQGMDWGTCMIFSCEKDCCVDKSGKAAKECWREEEVYIQTSI
ncbi:programmed cell death protein 2 [Collybia nuda]|uniref:Programmed cell death protein 2 n=1 Tax=Collybia nuda TaxID=64659 RepID=A0A9P5Y3A0_9AGAR|nr:programmed cell death protein 2 [Collybia nuda]